jgi:hypothetical protein
MRSTWANIFSKSEGGEGGGGGLIKNQGLLFRDGVPYWHGSYFLSVYGAD